eukprot:CAMPEP_0206236420 /NCGR_PEP_ID=MMETSP0047_2-20121206/13708_1 /ASSEMBLY_ACC=CAM_ASM_000192 /TAXON_ID=195065 /ORGANISM="Chroomonas mesostigmatica_cf, Strain CCMP1168" /LENGTH=458 /DNA_ID=CAMNT_0053660759 /DNA_START=459 /DNA_END=1835 /DNA_ORIENTATION=-
MSRNKDLETAFEQAMKECTRHPFRPNVGYLFISDFYFRQIEEEDESETPVEDCEEILHKVLKKYKIPQIPIIGCTGSGIIGQDIATGKPMEIEAFEDEEGGGAAISLVLAHVQGADVHGFVITKDSEFKEALQQLSAAVPDPERRSVRAVLLSNIVTRKGQALLQNTITDLGKRFPSAEVTGGLASSASDVFSRVFFMAPGGKPKFVQDGTVISLMSSAAPSKEGAEPLPLTHASVARNVSPKGPVFRLTEVEGDVVKGLTEVDEAGELRGAQRPVLSVLMELCDTGGGRLGFADHPNPNSSELHVLHVKAIMGGHCKMSIPESLGKAGNKSFLKEGMTVRCMVDSDGEDMERDVVEQMEWTKQRLARLDGFGNHVVQGVVADSWTTTRGALLFTCSGRGKGMYGRSHVDSEAFAKAFPEARGIAGFFCNGEIGPSHLGSTAIQMHGFTSVYTLYEGV